MRKQYDDFVQLKEKDMGKAISDMTYEYINPETNAPTRVPASHYEKILGQVREQYMADITSKQFLNIMFTQLNALKKEDEKYFYQALLCMDMNLKPNDLRIDEQISLAMTYDCIGRFQKENKKNFHFLNEEITGAFREFKEDPEVQRDMIRYSKMYDEKQRAEESGFNIEDYFKSSNNNQNRDMER